MSGFTIVELLIVMIVLGILMGLIFTTMNDLYMSNIREMRVLTQTTDIKSALDVVSKDASLAAHFSTVDTTDPIGPAPGLKWDAAPYTYEGVTDTIGVRRILIMQKYATNIPIGSDTTSDVNGVLDPQRKVLMSGDSCAVPIMNTLIFFVKDGTLYRRSVPGAATNDCVSQGILTNATRQSCQPGNTDTLCKATDAKLIDGVTGFKINYFLNPSEANDLTKALAYPADVSTARAVSLTLETTQGRGTQALKSSSSIVIALQNGGSDL